MSKSIFEVLWLENPADHNLGCASHSCKYIKPSGVATNGPCCCARTMPAGVERFLLRNLALMSAKLMKLEAEIEVDKILRGEE